MNKIIFPLSTKIVGMAAAVADLQDALQACLQHAAIKTPDERELQAYLEALQRERSQSAYLDVTQKLVAMFQQQHRIEASGDVDQTTADALNALLAEWGLLTTATGAAPDCSQWFNRRFSVLCHLVDARRAALPGLRVELWHIASNAPPELLTTGESDANGELALRFARADFSPEEDVSRGGNTGATSPNTVSRPRGPNLQFRVYRQSVLLAHIFPDTQSGDVLTDFTPQRAPIVLQVAEHAVVTGMVVQAHGAPAAQQAIHIHFPEFGHSQHERVNLVSDAQGHFLLRYDPLGVLRNLEIRIPDPHDGRKERVPGKARYGIGPYEEITVQLPAADSTLVSATEYARLTSDLRQQVTSIDRLALAQEDDERRDLSLLTRATGWDARLIALVALSEHLHAELDFERETCYGLLRAGLPSDPAMLARVAPEVALDALKQLSAQGIIAINERELTLFAGQFAAFVADQQLAIAAPGAPSSYRELLQSTALPSEVQNRFAPLFLQHGHDADALWAAARTAGISPAHVSQLQLHGKLSFLAGGSHQLVAHLLQKINSAQVDGDLAHLIELDLHHASQWQTELTALAGNDAAKLAALIPPAYEGVQLADRVNAFGADMARKLRLAYPNQIVARMLEQDQLPLPTADIDARASTAALLKRIASVGFKLGQTPVEHFLRNYDGPVEEADKQHLKTLQRVVQITPGMDAMPVMMALGLTSARQVMAYSEKEFITLYESQYQKTHGRMAATNEANLIHGKATQVSSIVYTLFGSAQSLLSEAPLAAMASSADAQDSAKNALIRQFPSMETLFGSLDYAQCNHCQSVLSPAAYLVDLLQLIDPDDTTWNNAISVWKKNHNDLPYPQKKGLDQPIKPYDVLIARRADIPHIELDCDNTHTALPYIDVVNEILEYYLANNAIKPEAAHNTGSISSEQLLAEPQNVINSAYQTLQETIYPLNLPYDLWLDTARQFCQHFETPLPTLLQTFQQGTALFDGGTQTGWARIFYETLQLAPAEQRLFTRSDWLSGGNWLGPYGLPNDSILTEAAALTELQSAKRLSRYLGVSYQNISDIVQTSFINPELDKLAPLYTFGISVSDALLYQQRLGTLTPNQKNDINAIRARLLAIASQHATLPAEIDQWMVAIDKWIDAIAFDKVLVLADPDTGGSFELTTLRYANGSACTPLDLLKINLLVRLWRKLGWSLSDTDSALQTFIPLKTPYDQLHMPEQPLRSALIGIAHVKTLDQQLRIGKNSRQKWLSLWGNLGTRGPKSVYAQLFLTPAILRNPATRAVFADVLGAYLSNPANHIKENLSTLQGALGLSADEIAQICQSLPLTTGVTDPLDLPLTLEVVSRLYRHRVLAQALKMSIKELLALAAISHCDPFAPLAETALADSAKLDDDIPFSHTLRFIDIANRVKASGLQITDLQYLLRHEFEADGKYQPKPEATQALLATLGNNIRAIAAEHASPTDPLNMDDATLQQKLGLMLPIEVVKTFMAMLDGTVDFSASISVPPGDTPLLGADFTEVARVRELSFNQVSRVQKLRLQGVVFDAASTDIMPPPPSTTPPTPPIPPTPTPPLLLTLLADLATQAHAFFAQHLLQSPAESNVSYGFLQETDYAKLFDPALIAPDVKSADKPEAKVQKNRRYRRKILIDAFLPVLRQRLIRQTVLQTISSQGSGAGSLDAQLVESLISDLLTLPALAAPGVPSATPQAASPLASLIATADLGLDATYFDKDDGSGPAQPCVAQQADADTSLRSPLTTGAPLPPANSACFEGWLEVPTPGAYRVQIETNTPGVSVMVLLEQGNTHLAWKAQSKDKALLLAGEPQDFVQLKPGQFYHFKVDLHNLNGTAARVLVQGEQLSSGALARLKLHPYSTWQQADSALLLLNKSLQLLQTLNLDEGEIRHLLSHASDFDGISLGYSGTPLVPGLVALPTADGSIAQNSAAFTPLLRLIDYARLKAELGCEGRQLIAIFTSSAPEPLLAQLMRRELPATLACATALGLSGFKDERALIRLWQGLQMVERFGVPVAELAAWCAIVDPAVPADPAAAKVANAARAGLTQQIKAGLKMRYDDEQWPQVAKPVYDKLRQHQRDALAQTIMQRLKLDRLEQLYEYFLIDPGMEPVVQTSRIRLAIASVQLFIQRCLLNLEKLVSPAVIKADQWQWMKRYRVWEANRKIFLYPENWLEPEFRDDKSHLFTELEGTLLQGDVSNDLVEDAFLTYLTKLDQLARLEMVAMHIQDNGKFGDRILHVIGRTYAKPHQYFYRRFAHQMWTPWQPMSVEIDGNHLAPIIWREQLYLFWVTFMEKPQMTAPPVATSNTMALSDATIGSVIGAAGKEAGLREVDVQLHWSHYHDGEWSAGEAGDFTSVMTYTTLPHVPGKGMASSKVGTTQYVLLDSIALPLLVDSKFNHAQVLVHVEKASDSEGNDLGVTIHLNGPQNFSFALYLAGRNSRPVAARAKADLDNPFSVNASQAHSTMYAGQGPLAVQYVQKITTPANAALKVNPAPPEQKPNTILASSHSYTLLPVNNEVSKLTPNGEAAAGASLPAAIEALLAKNIDQIQSLQNPVFYQDERHTFFVQPSVLEQTTEDWQAWSVPHPRPEPISWKEIPVLVANPWQPPKPGDPAPYEIIDRADWLTNPATVLVFGDSLIGPLGHSGLQVQTGVQNAATPDAGLVLQSTHPASGLAAGQMVAVLDQQALGQSGLAQVSAGLNVVGSAGFNAALQTNLNAFNSAGSHAALAQTTQGQH